jgi:hypothetical protein
MTEAERKRRQRALRRDRGSLVVTQPVTQPSDQPATSVAALEARIRDLEAALAYERREHADDRTAVEAHEGQRSTPTSGAGSESDLSGADAKLTRMFDWAWSRMEFYKAWATYHEMRGAYLKARLVGLAGRQGKNEAEFEDRLDQQIANSRVVGVLAAEMETAFDKVEWEEDELAEWEERGVVAESEEDDNGSEQGRAAGEDEATDH